MLSGGSAGMNGRLVTENLITNVEPRGNRISSLKHTKITIEPKSRNQLKKNMFK